MNMVPGTIRANGGPASVEFAGGVRLPMPTNAVGTDGQSVLYGMRPEHCLLAERSASSGEGAALPADVVVVEPTGADTQLYCRFNGQELTTLVRDRVSCQAGDRIGLRPDLARAHLFDAASGARLIRSSTPAA